MPPAVYVDKAEYAIFTGNSAGGTDPRIDGFISAASRMYDYLRGVAPGHFAPIAETTLTFTSEGGSTLYLRDARGMQRFLRTISANGLAFDSEDDGTFDGYTWDLGDGWVNALPFGALTEGEAYTQLRINARFSGAPLGAFPVGMYRITGTWGHAATHETVKARVCDIVHALSQRGYAGGYGAEEAMQAELIPAYIAHMLDSVESYRMPI